MEKQGERRKSRGRGDGATAMQQVFPFRILIVPAAPSSFFHPAVLSVRYLLFSPWLIDECEFTLNRGVRRWQVFFPSHALPIMETCTFMVACVHPSLTAQQRRSFTALKSPLSRSHRETRQRTRLRRLQLLHFLRNPSKNCSRILSHLKYLLKACVRNRRLPPVIWQQPADVCVASGFPQFVTFAAAAGLLEEAGISYTMRGSLSHKCS